MFYEMGEKYINFLTRRQRSRKEWTRRDWNILIIFELLLLADEYFFEYCEQYEYFAKIRNIM